MAWRPSEYLISGVLDNTQLGRVTGTLRFAGMDDLVRLDLAGDFHRDIRGAKLELLGDPNAGSRPADEARLFMAGLANVQTGTVGDITAGLPPHDYVRWVYVEWYSSQNGRVVLEYAPDRARVTGTPIPYQDSLPVSREQQAKNMSEFLRGIAEELGRGREVHADQDGAMGGSGE